MSWVKDDLEDGSMCTVDREEEQVAGGESQACVIQASCRACQGVDILQNATLEVIRPTQDPKGWWSPNPVLQLPQTKPFPPPRPPHPGPWESPQDDTENQALDIRLAASQAGDTCKLFSWGSKFWKICGLEAT